MYLDIYFKVKDTHPQEDEDYFTTWKTDETYFMDEWYIVYDRLGDGCKIDFPIRLESRIKWSSQVFSRSGSVKPKIFKEMIYVTLVKSRC